MADGVSPVVDTNLGPPPPQQGGGVAGASGVVGMMSELAEMRNRQNQNLLFQQQMSARHQLGQDLTVWASQGLSPEEQISRASHQPYAPFVTPEIANFRSSNLAGAQVQQVETAIGELQQRVANTGLQGLTQALAATGGDQAKFDAAFKAATAGQPPSVQRSMAKSYGAIKDSLTANLPDDPDAARAEIASRTRNLGVAFGLPLDKAYGMTGGVAPTLTDVVGPQGQTNKVIASGGGAGPLNATVLGTGPTTAQQEEMKIQGQQRAGLPPTMVDVPGGGKSYVSGVPASSSPLVAGPPPSTSSPPRPAQDGSALFAPDAALPPQLRTNLTGTKAFASPMQAEIAQSAAKRWDDAQPMYDQIAQTNATIGSMLAETHNSAKTGGMLTPGFAGESRTTLAKIVNLANDWVNPGAKPVFDPLAVAGNESMEKQARQTAFQLIGQLGGGERGLGVLQNALDSVPSLSKTPLGNIVVGESIQAMGKWRLVQQEYMRDWAARTGGDLTGAEAQYLKDHPPEKVLGAVLAKHGINPAETGEVKAAPAKVTHRWNPATGSIEEVK